MTKVIRKLGLLCILLDNLFVPGEYSFDFRLHYILYSLFIAYYLFTHRTVRLKPSIFVFTLFLFVLTIVVPYIKDFTYVEPSRQLLLIGFNLLFAFILINAYQFDLLSVFHDYIQLICLASVVGLIQLFSQIVGFQYGADFSYLGFDMQNFTMENWKIQSWFQEPSFLAIAFMPAVFLSISRFFKLSSLLSRGKAALIILTMVLSQSSVGLLGILFSFAIIITNKYSILKSPMLMGGASIILLWLSLSFYAIPQVQVRVDDTAKLFFSKNVTAHDIEQANLSTYAMYSNFRVVQAAYRESPIFGSGLGTYVLDYARLIHMVLPENQITELYQLNNTDANSMLFRILAEMGLFGVAILSWFLIANRIRVDWSLATQVQVELWVINSSILVLFLIRLVRQGHYTMLGFMLFVILYACSARQFRDSVHEQLLPPLQ